MPWNLTKAHTFVTSNGWDAIEGTVISPSGVPVVLDTPAGEFIDCGDIGVAVYIRLGKNAVAYRSDGSIVWAVGTGVKSASDDKQGFTGGWCDGDTVRLYDPAGYVDHFRVADGVWLSTDWTK
jgi:hypothetical protein